MTVVQNGQPTPAVNNTTGGTKATAAWTPVSGHDYLIFVAYNTNGSGVAQSTSLAWSTGGANCTAPTLEKLQNLNLFHPSAEVWFTSCTGAAGSSVITATGNAFATEVGVIIVDITGDLSSAPMGSTPQGATSGLTIAVTPATTGGLIFECGYDSASSTTATAAAGCTLIEFLSYIDGERFWVTCASTNTVATVPQTVGVTSSSTVTEAQIGIEVAPAPTSTAPMPQPHVVTRQALVRASSY